MGRFFKYFQDMSVKKFCPCKVNLMLAITGARADGFHNLVSLVAPTRFGDELEASALPASALCDELICDMPGVPCDSSNLVLKAADIFRRRSGVGNFFKFDLRKKTPAGAGLGGGSSNGAAALAAANELSGGPLSPRELEELAAELGSDCPLFLTGNPVVMRGRGEKVFPLAGEAKDYIGMLRLLLFKPAFSINTGWAYAQMRANPQVYIDADFAEAKLSEWLENPSITGLPLINNMQVEAFKKYPALEVALESVRENFGVPAMMSGSGSACFAIVNNLDAEGVRSLKEHVRSLLGESCFIAEA